MSTRMTGGQQGCTCRPSKKYKKIPIFFWRQEDIRLTVEAHELVREQALKKKSLVKENGNKVNVIFTCLVYVWR